MLYINNRPNHLPEFEQAEIRKAQQAEIDEWLSRGKPFRLRLTKQDAAKFWDKFLTIFGHKCAYCEIKFNHAHEADISRFRPPENARQAKFLWTKQEYENLADEHHYRWLSWQWTNLYPACRDCIKKGAVFPLEQGYTRALPGTYGIEQLYIQEHPLLLDPCFDQPARHLEFQEDGHVQGLDERGDTTIQLFNLNRDLLSNRRQEQAKILKELFEVGLNATANNQGLIDGYIQDVITELYANCQADQEFAGMKRQLLHDWLHAHLSSTDTLPVVKYALANTQWKALKDWLVQWRTASTPLDKCQSRLEPTVGNLDPMNSRHVRLLDTFGGIFPSPIRNRWALLIGINQYIDPAFPTLSFCVNDVVKLQDLLEPLGYTVIALHDNAPTHLKPTRLNIEAELTRLHKVAQEDDLFYVHFSGHGDLREGKRLLITQEAREPTLARTAITLAEIEAQMRSSRARQLVLTVDACRVGVEMSRQAVDPDLVSNVYDAAAGFAMIAASTAQQNSYESSQAQHGIFTSLLLRGLRGEAAREDKAFVTINDLNEFILNQLRKLYIKHQRPLQESTIRVEGMGNMILADYRRS